MMRFLVLLFLAAALLAPRPAAAQTLADYDYENLEFRGIGIDFGYVFPGRVERDLSLGVRADLGYLGPNVRIVPGISFWSSQLKRDAIEGLADQINELCRSGSGVSCVEPEDLGELDLSDLVVHLDAFYEFETTVAPVPYLGAGAGLHLLNGPGTLLDAVTAGINLIGGVSLPVGDNLSVFAEARYLFVPDVYGAAIDVGGIWMFGPPPPGARSIPRR